MCIERTRDKLMGYLIQRQDKKTLFTVSVVKHGSSLPRNAVGIFILLDTQSLTRHNPEQPAPADLLLPCAKIRKYHKVILTELLQCINV